MKIEVLLFASLSILFLSFNSPAADFGGESRTYFQARENAEEDLLLPLHEYLDFHVDGISDMDLSLHFGGWLRRDLNDNESFNERSSESDLQYGYLSIKNKKMNGFLNIGRVLVFEGIASEQVDGVSLGTDISTDISRVFRISAYGGVPVETDFDDRKGNYVYGGRLSHEFRNHYIVGVSYLKEENDHTDFRQEAGADLWWMPFNRFEISGQSLYNAETEDWMEHAYFVAIGPFQRLRFNGEATWISYEDYFYSTESSAFAFRPGVLDPEEEVLILGGNVELRLTDTFSVVGDYKNYDYEKADSADYHGGSIKYMNPESWGFGLSVHRMEGEIDKLRYNQYRAYMTMSTGRIDATLDLFDIDYDEKINDVEHAYSAVLALGHNLVKTVRIAIDISYSENPEFDEDVRVLLKLIYRFGTDSGA